MDEIERIKKAYARRDLLITDDRYSYFNQANLFIVHRREKEMLRLLQYAGMNSLKDKRILDVGCGRGRELQRFVDYGALSKNLFGIDLLPERIDQAQELNPGVDFKCGDAQKLPCKDESFDIVLQFTLFTSILDKQMKENIAKEMLRVLRREGIILWYDYHVNNPKNPAVKGVKKKEIKQLFPNCSFRFRRITLAPPLTRRIAPHSLLLCYLLEKMPLLCTHYLAVIKKQNL